MNPPNPKRGKFRPKHKKWLIGGVIALVLAGTLGVLGKRYYPKYNAERLVKNARGFLVNKDYQSAAITAQRALQVDDRNVTAVRILVQITEKFGNPAALTWRKRLAELEPAELDNQLSLAELALNFGDLALAKEALAAAEEMGKGRGRYHALAGRAAVAAKQMTKADEEFAEAARLEPTHGTYQLRLHLGRLRSPDPETREQATAALDALLEQPDIFPQTSRLLIADAVERNDAARALVLAEELQKTPVATFQDHLVYLGLLQQLSRTKYASYLTELQEKAAENPEQIYSLMLWLIDRQSALVVVDWAKRLTPEMTAAMPVPVALAQAYVRLRDWARLKPIVSDPPASPTDAMGSAGTKWGDFEFMRLAFLAAVRRAEGDAQKSRILWSGAVKAASDRPAAITTLARYAIAWGWEADATDLLWKVARETPEPLWALKVLYTHYESTQATSSLHQVARRVLEIQRTNPDMQNNAAMLALLLGSNVAEAVEAARQLYEREPKNASYLSTYALGLFLQGYPPKAAELIQTLDPAQRQQPAVAVYCGIILSATEAKEEARKYLELAKEARLLPEEKKLIEQAWERVDKSPAAETAPPAP